MAPPSVGSLKTTVGAHDQLLMGVDLPNWAEDYLDFWATDTRSEWVRPSLSASSAAPFRVLAPSLPRIADTWCSTVLTEMNKLAEISSLDWPSERSSRISCSRGVRPRGWALVAVRAPVGMERIPRSLMRLRTSRAAASAPRSESRANDSR